MEILIVVVAILVLGAAAVASAGGLGQMSAEPVRDTYAPTLPADGPLRADDLEDVRFGVVPRGYDMEEVDAVMARVARELDGRGPGAAPTGDTQTESVEGRPPGPARRARVEPSVSERASAWRGRRRADVDSADGTEAERPGPP